MASTINSDQIKLEHHFDLLLTAMNKRRIDNAGDVGGYYLDSIKPGGTRLFRIEEIISTTGGTRSPFGEQRYTRGQLMEVIRFAIYAIEASNRA